MLCIAKHDKSSKHHHGGRALHALGYPKAKNPVLPAIGDIVSGWVQQRKRDNPEAISDTNTAVLPVTTE